MKTHPRANRAVTISSARWLAYAGAGAATALTSAAPVKADIHYSGRVDTVFRYDDEKTVRFPLDKPSDFIAFEHDLSGQGVGQVYFQVEAAGPVGFVGTYRGFEYGSVARITGRDGYISQGHFIRYSVGTMVRGNRSFYLFGRWKAKGTDFVAFRFDGGAGFQYGWARVHMGGKSENFAFKVLDYAYADVGESIMPGQRTSGAANRLAQGSLGALALGGAGLLAWRRQRAKNAARQ